MRTGLLVPISSNALAFAFIAALIFTIIWMIYHFLIHSSKKQVERNFNKVSSSSEYVDLLSTNDASDLFVKFPNRKINIDAGTKIFWTSENPLSIAIAQANAQSPLKVYVRVNGSARELGHQINIGNDGGIKINLSLTAESLIFSDNNSSFYAINSSNLNQLNEILRSKNATINQRIQVPENDAVNISAWIDKIIKVQVTNEDILLIGE